MKRRILFYESLGFVFLIVWCWLDEVADLPAVIFGAPPSSPNITEAIEESVIIALFGISVVYTSFRLLNKIRILEGFLPTCAFCKKIRVGDDWQLMEDYFSKRSDARFSHSFCPSCMKQHYGIDTQ